MRLSAFLLVLSGLSGLTVAWDDPSGCVEGIRTVLAEVTFNASDPADYWTNLCATDMIVRSLWVAAKLYCTPFEIKAGGRTFGGYCEEYGSVELTPYSKVRPELTDEYINSLPLVGYSDIEAHTIWNTSIRLSEEVVMSGVHTYVYFEYEYILHERYGWALYGFWGGLLLVGIINRLITHFSQSRRANTSADLEGGQQVSKASKPIAVVSSIYHWFRANFIIPATFGSHHSRPVLWSTIPTRLETLVVVLFYILTFIMCCVSYYIIYPNFYYTKAQQAWRYIADRTGIMSYACLPWLFMFSGRNNVFLWLTGWSFGTFNIFHRHISRAATILAIVHSINYSVLEAGFDYYTESWKEQYWYMGNMATIAMSLILLFSMMWFRVKSYEVFLLIHIALSVVTLVGLFYHTKIFDGEYNGYLWPPVAIWCFDRAARIVRWMYCNIHVRSNSVLATKALATYNKDGDFVRLEIVPGSDFLKPGPGQHYYLYQPLKWKGWENHPFTLAAYETIGRAGAAAEVETNVTKEAIEKEIQAHPESSGSDTPTRSISVRSQHDVTAFPDAVGRQKLTFIVRPFGSWTRRLKEECLKSPDGVIAPKIFIEGPYGERSPLLSFETVVFIVGGSGIAGALPYMQQHIKAKEQGGEDAGDGKKLTTITRDIHFIWTTRQSTMIRDVAARELQPMLGRDDVHFHLHATSGKEAIHGSDSDSQASAVVETRKLAPVISAREKINITYGRPDIKASISEIIEEVNDAGSKGGRIAILTCGPAAMADDARAAVHAALKQGKRGVEYFEETFG
ncbi:hypothetical protein PV08_11899 [Exophiala spinifera]|uniref:FAD-binding FR-type domain-containing protein n=1 Tax=Exophiala spinifera TaxID=91928 RepID=A0A0D2ASU6_9EURO|nr:uncharacterized protein PV08_11899 [Exophiala spinifera]KIW09798.1 hypothetical protein PV08_11899 [Exophiala spinifera]